jgi:isopentenyl-diphosphate delta-isomerase
MNSSNNIVSFDDEKLIVVDGQDNILGYKTKEECHQGSGILHRAFSVFIFNDKKELLLQRRSDQKLLWPLYWSNSCCSHPRKGENIEDASHRRTQEELGLTTRLKYLYKFQYQASFKNFGSENELCSVYIGKANGAVEANQNEIAEWKYIDLPVLDIELQKKSELYTPWFKLEWDRIRRDYMDQINTLF